MGKKSIGKVHTKIGHARSLCGLAPKNGEYKIVPNSEFFAASDDDQCSVCLKHLQKKGYAVSDLIQQFRNLYAKAQQLSLSV